MIAKAAERACYDVAIAADLGSVLEVAVAAIGDGTRSNRLLFDSVIAADTFIYVGILGKVFSQTRKILKCGGFFAFSTEDLLKSPFHTDSITNIDAITTSTTTTTTTTATTLTYQDDEVVGAVPGWGAKLLPKSARFAHSNTYIEELARHYGFGIVAATEITLRLESSVPIPGYAYVLRRSTE